MLSKSGARHKVYKTTWKSAEKSDADEFCVLKKYELAAEGDWKCLVKEVRLLGELAHSPYIADVQAVFVQQDPHAAYVQLPFYAGGDLLQWLCRYSPPVSKRKELLGHLAHALQYIHERGVAHGDIKLENVLVAIEGERVSAHLADFDGSPAAHRRHQDGH